jgi:hypothetical protein
VTGCLTTREQRALLVSLSDLSLTLLNVLLHLCRRVERPRERNLTWVRGLGWGVVRIDNLVDLWQA